MSHLLQLLLLLTVILFTSKYAGYISLRLGQPAVFGKIALGLLLGPTLLNIMQWHVGALYLFGGADGGAAVQHTLKDLAELGVILLMFMAGLETDLKAVLRVGKVAFWAAIGGLLAPMLAAFGATEVFSRLGSAAGLSFSPYEALFIGTVLTATSVSISAQTLFELGRLRTKEGSAILGAAVIDDVIGIIVLSFVIAFKPAGLGTSAAEPERLLDWIMLGLGAVGLSPAAVGGVRIALLIAMMVLFFVLAVLADRLLLQPLLKRFERLPVSEGLLSGTLIVGLLYAWGAEWIGNVAAITGSYLAGVLISRQAIKEQVAEKLHTLTYSFFVPVFFVSIGLEANARPIFAPLLDPAAMTQRQWLLLWLTLALIALAVLAKVLGCQLGAKLAGFSWREGYKVGVGMISRGEVGIIIALVGLNAGIINAEIFAIMVLMVLATTLITPLWLKAVFKDDGPAAPETQPAPPALDGEA